MKCEKCGKQINSLLIDTFNYDGSDNYYEYPIKEYEENAATIDVYHDWTGYELTEEEQKNTIHCPYCNQFPFICEEIQTENIVRIICFKRSDNNAK